MKPSYIRAASALLAAAGVLLSSCSTTKGFGRDLQKVGNKIENKADEVQHGY